MWCSGCAITWPFVRVTFNDAQALLWTCGFNPGIKLQLHGISVFNCKLTCASFQENPVISLGRWLLEAVPHTHLSQVYLLLTLNNLSLLMEACSHHSCSYGINYDRLSMINELIPIICRVCVCVDTVCMHKYVFVIYQHGQILSIHKARIRRHLPLTFLIAIDLFAGHKYLWWNPLSRVYTGTHTHMRASNLFAHLLDEEVVQCFWTPLQHCLFFFFFDLVILASRGQHKSKWKRFC